MTMGEKLAILRKRKNITQEQLSEILNVSRQSVSRWEMELIYPMIKQEFIDHDEIFFIIFKVMIEHVSII